MQSIYSSKLYKASPRKQHIKAALLSQGNLALVKQLAESLDDQYQTPENLGLEPEKPKSEPTETNDLFVDEDINPETDLMTMNDMAGSRSSGPSHSVSHSVPSEPSSPEDSSVETDELIPESPANEKPQKEEPEPEPAEASTKIMSCTCVDLNTLKGTLNSREDTHGVSRIAEKENEIWIYYNDDINLNNLMVEVIEAVIEAGYTELEFNRLARSDNAIVFSINFQTTTRPDKSIEEAAKEEK